MVEARTDRTGRRGWRDEAACRGTDPEAFFPTAERGPIRDAEVAAARAVCAGCPVRDACLEWALDAMAYGIAGGLTEVERREFRGRQLALRPRTASVTPAAPADARELARSGRRSEVIAAGQAALAVGRPRAEVAAEFGVQMRTVERWAATTPRTTGALVSGGAA